MFSICIPLYNTQEYIRPCLDSVLAQTEKNFEAIVVDDGSTDSSSAIADEYAQRDSRIKAIHQKNKGLFHTRLVAYGISTGRYIVNLDSDDYLEPHALQTMKRIIQQQNADLLIYNRYIINGERKRIVGNALFTDGETWGRKDKDSLLRVFCMSNELTPIWRKAIRRDLIETSALEHYPRITMYEDWVHSFYPMLNASKIVHITEPLINYRILAASMTRVFDPALFLGIGIVRELQMNLLRIDNLSSLTAEDVDLQYLLSVAKCVVYAPGRVRSNASYLDLLSVIRKDPTFLSVYEKHKGALPLVSALPLGLLVRKQDKMLLQLKKVIAPLRKP